MKTYNVSDELVNTLKLNGFIETSNTKNGGKREFQLSKSSSKKIYFDYEDIQIWKSIWMQDNKHNLSTNDLKAILIYFKMPIADYKEINSDNNFRFSNISDKLTSIRRELDLLREVNKKHIRQLKLERIIDFYENLIVDN